MKKAFTWLLALITSASLPATDVYQCVKLIPLDVENWFNNPAQLEKIFEENSIKTVVELGSWTGASTIFFGNKVGPDGVVLAVDSWLGSPEPAAHTYDNYRFSYIYHLFLSNIKRHGLTDRIVPIRMLTSEAAKAIEVEADLVYVDAEHTEEGVYRDIMEWYPFLKEGGIMCGDDWVLRDIKAGVKRAADELGMSIYHEGHFWRLYHERPFHQKDPT